MENLAQNNLFDIPADSFEGDIPPVEAGNGISPDDAIRDQELISGLQSDYQQANDYESMLRGDLDAKEYYSRYSGFGTDEPQDPSQGPVEAPPPVQPVAPTPAPDPALQEYEVMKQYMPLIKYVVENPDAAQHMKQFIQEKSKPKPSLMEEVQGLQAPVKPADFNPIDASTDPESPSAKYITELTNYQEKVALAQHEYVKKVYEERQQEEIRRETNERLKTVYGNLISNYQLSPQEAQDFVKVFSDDKSLELGNLVSYYRFMKGQSRQAPAQVPQRGVPQQTVKPQARMQQQPQQQLSDSDLFNMQLFAAAKKRPLMS